MDLLHFEIEGASPLLMNNPVGTMTTGGNGGKPDKGPKQIPTPEEDAKVRTYSSNGHLVVPAHALRKAWLIASSGYSSKPASGGRKISTKVHGDRFFI